MSNIRDVIDTLCTLLAHHGFTKISSEVLRQAKFNKPEASHHLLALMKEILQSFSASSGIGDGNFILVLILCRLGYPNLSSCLTLINNKVPSSRELLLMFGFLLTKLDIIRSLGTKSMNAVIDCIFSNVTNERTRLNSCHGRSVDCNKIIVLRKKIDFAFRALASTLEQYDKLLQKVSRIQHGKLLSEFPSKLYKPALFDFLIHSNMKMQNEALTSLTKHNNLLKLHCKWITHEPLFWRWMASVTREISDDDSAPEDDDFHQQLHISLLTCSDDVFQTITSHYGLNYMNVLLKKPRLSMQILRQVMQTNLGCRDETVNSCVGGGNTDFRQKIEELKEENKIWLCRVLNEHFPDLVSLPTPRR